VTVANFYLSVSLQGFLFTDNVTTTEGYSLGKVVSEMDCSCSNASKYGKILKSNTQSCNKN
jgi:hypothetical protein